jgi:hypothetical protein
MECHLYIACHVSHVAIEIRATPDDVRIAYHEYVLQSTGNAQSHYCNAQSVNWHR